jgi:antitoxin PrlF
MTSSVTSKGQVTIPKHLRKKFGIAEGTKMAFTAAADGIRLRKVVDSAKARSVVGCLREELKGRTVSEIMDELRGPVEIPKRRLRKPAR